MNRSWLTYLASIAILLLAGCKKEAPAPEKISVEGGETVQFEAPITYPNADYYWEFGDGQTANTRDPEHIFVNAGSHLVTLQISRNGKLIQKLKPYLVYVSQLYVPRIDSGRIESADQDYLYKDEDTFVGFHVSQEIQDDDSYSYEVYIDGSLTYTSISNLHVFNDSGNYDLKFKLIDKNGVSGTLDTTVYIGSDKTYLNFNLPDANLSPLGSITEKYVVVYRNKQVYYQGDYQDFLDYPGPTSNNLINNGELMNYYGPGPNDYIYFSFDPLGYQALGAISNGMSFSINVPAYDWPSDYDDLKAFLLIVGTNGINISELEMPITPGTIVPSYDFPAPVFYSY